MASTPLMVLYEDASLLVVNKPCGMHTAPLHEGEKGTLLGCVIAAFPEVGELPGVRSVEPGLVHRLDRDTSGLVVVARTPQAFEALRGLFEAGRSRKSYLAACAAAVEEEGAARGATLRIESRFAPYGEGRTMVRVVLPQETPKGKRARSLTRDQYCTEATVIARAPGRALILAHIARGFRHQVRAHLSFLGYPIFGDRLYGTPVPDGYASRMYLHACDIGLEHPETKESFRVSSPPPPEFNALFPGYSTFPTKGASA